MARKKTSVTRKPSNTNKLSKNDIISIIRHCRKYDVQKLTIEGLEIELGEKTDAATVPYSPLRKQNENEDVPLPNEATQNELADLLVTDPQAWEELENSRKEEDFGETTQNRRFK